MIPIIAAFAPVFGKVIDRAIDKVFPDTEKRDLAKIEIMAQLQEQSAEIQQAAASIIKTEAASQHWLAANWRPLTMLIFVGLIVARWLGFSSDSMTEAEYLAVYALIKLGLGGYVGGRTLEKIAPGLISSLTKK